MRDETKESDGALFLVRDRYGDDFRRIALLCLPGPNEALVAEVDRDTGPVAAAVGVGAHAGGAFARVFRANGMKSDALITLEGWGGRVGKFESEGIVSIGI